MSLQNDSGEDELRSIVAYRPKHGLFSEVAARHRDSFRSEKPYSHAVLDGLFPARLLDAIISEVPPFDAPVWRRWSSTGDIVHGFPPKLAISALDKLGPTTSYFLLYLNSGLFVRFLEQLTGIEKLIPDPSFRGAGLQCTRRGGILDIHTDPERHPFGQPFCQMLNLILYLNRDWQEGYGGDLELWASDATRCMKAISPVFNRTVLFESGSTTYHGHPKPLECPSDRGRLSLAVFYYILNRELGPAYNRDYEGVTWADMER